MLVLLSFAQCGPLLWTFPPLCPRRALFGGPLRPVFHSTPDSTFRQAFSLSSLHFAELGKDGLFAVNRESAPNAFAMAVVDDNAQIAFKGAIVSFNYPFGADLSFDHLLQIVKINHFAIPKAERQEGPADSPLNMPYQA